MIARFLLRLLFRIFLFHLVLLLSLLCLKALPFPLVLPRVRPFLLAFMWSLLTPFCLISTLFLIPGLLIPFGIPLIFLFQRLLMVIVVLRCRIISILYVIRFCHVLVLSCQLGNVVLYLINMIIFSILVLLNVTSQVSFIVTLFLFCHIFLLLNVRLTQIIYVPSLLVVSWKIIRVGPTDFQRPSPFVFLLMMLMVNWALNGLFRKGLQLSLPYLASWLIIFPNIFPNNPLKELSTDAE